MHSSRMRTACLLTVSGSGWKGVCLGSVCLVGGVCLEGRSAYGCLPKGGVCPKECFLLFVFICYISRCSDNDRCNAYTYQMNTFTCELFQELSGSCQGQMHTEKEDSPIFKGKNLLYWDR